MIVRGHMVSLWVTAMFKIACGDGCTTVNMLKIIELYTLNG